MNLNVTSNVGFVEDSKGIKYVALAYQTNYYAYSTDGTNWTESTLPNSSSWTGICYANGKYVAISSASNCAVSTDGINWTNGSIPSGYKSICYGNDLFVAIKKVATANFAYSTDGITWTEGNMRSTSRWTSICYGNGKFVVTTVNNSSKFAYSTNGTTWTEGTISSTSRNWQCVCYGNDRFVAIASGSYSAYSTDGINWTENSMNVDTTIGWYSICYGNGKFVATGIVNADCKVAYSTDGISWTEGIVFTDDSASHAYGDPKICYGNGKFIIVNYCTDDNKGDIADNSLSYSTDGITWTTKKISNTAREWYSVCYGDKSDSPVMAFNLSHPESASGDKFSDKVILDAVVHHDSPMYLMINQVNTNNSFYIQSPNLGDYELTSDYLDRQKYPVGNNMNKNCIGGKLHPLSDGFVAYSVYGNNFNTTSKQSDTATGKMELITGVFKANPFMGYYNGSHGINFYGMDNDVDEFMVPYRDIVKVKYVSVVNGNKVYAYSEDGITWNETTSGLSSRNWYSVCYGNGKFVAITYNSNYSAYSEDGIHWVENAISDTSRGWLSVCYGNGKFVVIAKATSTYAYSSDGIHWTERTLPNSRNWYSVCYGNGMFVVVGYTYGLAYSSDGINWTEVSVTSTYWNSVCYGNGKFVAVAKNTTHVMYSTDGITWTDSTLPNSRAWVSVCYGNGKFVTVANSSNVIAYSTDGITWTEGTISDTERTWNSICYGNGKFVMVATQSTVYAYSKDGVTWTEANMTNGRYWNSVCSRDTTFVEFSNDHTGISTDATDANGVSTMITYTEQYADDIYYIHYAWVDRVSSSSIRYNILTRKIDTSVSTPRITNVVSYTTTMATGDIAHPSFYMDSNKVLHCAFYHNNTSYAVYYKLTRNSTDDSSWSWGTDDSQITNSNTSLMTNYTNNGLYTHMVQSARRMYMVNTNSKLVEFKKNQSF